MQITNRGINNAPLTPQAPVESAGASSTPTGPGAAAGSDSYTPSAELTNLLAQVRSQPEVRSDRVDSARHRVHQGHYNTQASIEQTAQAIITAAGN